MPTKGEGCIKDFTGCVLSLSFTSKDMPFGDTNVFILLSHMESTF